VDDFGNRRFRLRVGGEQTAYACNNTRVASSDERWAEADVAPLRVEEPRNVAKRRVGRHAQPHTNARKLGNTLQRVAIPRGSWLLVVAEEAECSRVPELRHERLVVTAVRGFPVDAADASDRSASEHNDVDSKQPARPDGDAEIGVSLRRDDVAHRDRRLVQPAASELAHRFAGAKSAEDDRHAFPSRYYSPPRAAHERERARDEPRRGGDRGQRVRKTAPGRVQLDHERRCRGRGDSHRLREQPARRSGT
jgi:hypothetical protein